MNKNQLTRSTPFGALPAYVQFLLHTKCSALREHIPSIRTLQKSMDVVRSVKEWGWKTHHYANYSWYHGPQRIYVYDTFQRRMNVSDPRADSIAKITTVLDATAMLRFMHRMQHWKKEKQIGLVYTKVDLAGLEQETSLTMKSFSTPQHDSDMIKHFGKDLLISGFLRQFSHGTVYDDVEEMCLRFYHLNGAAHEYQRKFTSNELVPCNWYNSLVEWEEAPSWRRPDDYNGTAYLCLSAVWDGAFEGKSKNAHLYSLLPVYRVSVEEKNDDANWTGNRSAEISKKARNRYIERKWSAYHKLNRM